MPDRVALLLGLAGGAAVVDGAIRLALAPAVVSTSALEVAEAVFAGAWVLFVVVLRRAAPRVAAVTSLILDLGEIVHLPAGLGLTALAGAAVLIPPTAAFTDSLTPLELTNAAPVVIAIGVVRFAWVTRVVPRPVGLAVTILWAVGAFASGTVAGGRPVPILASAAAALAGVAWVLFGLWLVVVAGRLRGAVPIAAFRPPGDVKAVPGPRPSPAEPRRRPQGAPARLRTVRDRGVEASLRRQRRWRKTRSRSRHGIDELARRLGVSGADLRAARPTYSTFSIPKRSGGARTITAPDAATKALQRRVLRRLLARLPAHDAAHGFERGRSIVTNATRHPAPAVLVKLDVEDFFGRTRAVRVHRFWRVIGWDREAARILTRLTTVAGGLPQGAPTSPRLANLVNVRLDARLAGIAAVHGAIYTRYADDLTFSFATDRGASVRELIHAVRKICHDEGRYELHRNRKVEIRRRHERQEITGLIVNDGPPRLSRARRRWLRAVEYRRYSGGTPTIDDAALRGGQALESMVEVQAGRTEPTA